MNWSSLRSNLSALTIVLRALAVVSGILTLVKIFGWGSWLPGKETLKTMDTAIASGLTLVGSFATDAVSSKLPANLPPAKRNRNRTNLLDKVRTYWIEGLLKSSLHNSVLLVLGLKTDSGAVEHSWTNFQQSEHSAQPLPSGSKIIEVFDQTRGALLILGAPGSGKTTALLELTRDLLNRAARDDEHPIPVVFNLSRWAGKRLSISEWLIDELSIQYQVPVELGAAWVDEEEILPLLDGLDEVEREHQAACVEAINKFRQKHNAVDIVVCSRSADYNAIGTKLELKFS